jgi:hypothetical protein
MSWDEIKKEVFKKCAAEELKKELNAKISTRG